MKKDFISKIVFVRYPSKYLDIMDLVSSDINGVITGEGIDLIREATGNVEGIIYSVEQAIRNKKILFLQTRHLYINIMKN